MPATKLVPRKGMVIGKKGGAVAKKVPKPDNKRKKEDSEYEGFEASGNEDQENPASNDSNDVDMELIRAAFVTAKSKHIKKQNAEFLRQQKMLIDSAREQAEAIQTAGNVHLAKLVEQFEALCEVPDNSDIRSFAAPVGRRADAANDLHRASTSALEQVTVSYDTAIQAVGQEFQNRAACREEIRRQTNWHARRILERGVEEQKLITDATELIKNFQRLMSM